MAKKSTVSARIDDDIKNRAEDILKKLGIPVSVVLNTLYCQIIARNGLPFPLTLPRELKALDTLSDAELDSILSSSYEQAKNRQGSSLDEVFDELERNHPDENL